MCRFISLNQKDIFLIKNPIETPIENQFLIAKLNDDGNGIQKENLENDVDESCGFTKSKVSFSNLICKNNIIDALDEMLARKNIEGYKKIN